MLPTDLSVVIVDDDGANRIVSTSFCADTITPDEAAAFADAIQPGDIFLMQGNLSRAATEGAAKTAAARGGTTVLNLAPFRWDKGADMPACHLIVNALEATQATGRDNPRLAARALCRAGARVAIVTLGGAGCLVETGDACREFSAATVDVVDTTGAGDTFCGVFAAGLAAGMDMADIIGWAQRAAAITVTRPGAFEALPSAHELAACMR
jgi:ribokinase